MKIALILIAIAALETTAIATPVSPTAEDLYTQGQLAYDKADYTTAIARWQASYALSKESILLFNIAQAQRQSGDCHGALASYRSFLATDLDQTSDQRKLAEDFIAELATTCVDLQIVSRPPPAGKAENHGRTLRIAGIATGASGAAATLTGLLLGQHAQGLADEVTTACRTSCDWATQKDKDAAGRRDAAIGRVLDVVGVAAIASGVVMYYLGSQESVTVTPMPGEHGAIFSWSGTWSAP